MRDARSSEQISQSIHDGRRERLLRSGVLANDVLCSRANENLVGTIDHSGLTAAMNLAIRMDALVAFPAYATRPSACSAVAPGPMIPIPTGLLYSSSSCLKMSEQVAPISWPCSVDPFSMYPTTTTASIASDSSIFSTTSGASYVPGTQITSSIVAPCGEREREGIGREGRGSSSGAKRRFGSRKVGGRVGPHHVRGGDARVLEHQVHEPVVELADDHAQTDGIRGAVAHVEHGRVLPLPRLLRGLMREHDRVVSLLDAAGGVEGVLLWELGALIRGSGDDATVARGLGRALGSANDGGGAQSMGQSTRAADPIRDKKREGGYNEERATRAMEALTATRAGAPRVMRAR